MTSRVGRLECPTRRLFDGRNTGVVAGRRLAPQLAELAAEGFAELPVTVRHAQHAGAIPGPHKDPFDRMLIAQALAEGMALVSNETLFDGFAVTRVW